MAAERMTFTVPPELKRKAQQRRDVNWSAVVARAIEERLLTFEMLENASRSSRLTQRDVDEITSSVNQSMAEHYGRKFRKSSSTPTD